MNAEVGTRNAEVKAPIFHVGETVWSSIADGERGMVTGVLDRGTHYSFYVCWATGHNAAEREFLAIELSREALYQQSTR